MNKWIDHIYGNDEERALDFLFDHVDDMFLKGEFIECDIALQSIILDRLSETMLIGIMAIMYAARDSLPSYKSILNKIEDRLRALCPDRANALMHGFRE